jgi:hypothetical protein
MVNLLLRYDFDVPVHTDRGVVDAEYIQLIRCINQRIKSTSKSETTRLTES